MPCFNCIEPKERNLILCSGVLIKNYPEAHAARRCLTCGQFFAEYFMEDSFRGNPIIPIEMKYVPVPTRKVMCKNRAIKNCPKMKGQVAA